MLDPRLSLNTVRKIYENDPSNFLAYIDFFESIPTYEPHLIREKATGIHYYLYMDYVRGIILLYCPINSTNIVYSVALTGLASGGGSTIMQHDQKFLSYYKEIDELTLMTQFEKAVQVLQPKFEHFDVTFYSEFFLALTGLGKTYIIFLSSNSYETKIISRTELPCVVPMENLEDFQASIRSETKRLALASTISEISILDSTLDIPLGTHSAKVDMVYHGDKYPSSKRSKNESSSFITKCQGYYITLDIAI